MSDTADGYRAAMDFYARAASVWDELERLAVSQGEQVRAQQLGAEADRARAAADAAQQKAGGMTRTQALAEKDRALRPGLGSIGRA